MNRVILLTLMVLVAVSFSEAEGEESLVLTGVVLDGHARPVADAEVAAYEKSLDYTTSQETSQLLSEPVRTNAEGEFRIPVTIRDQYNVFVVARKPGLAYAWDGLNYGWNMKAYTHFQLILEEACQIGGRVVDAEGKPIAQARVQAVPKTSYLSRLRQRPILAPEEWFTTRTDSQGRFTFHCFAAEVNVDFLVSAAGWETQYKYSPHYLSGCGYEVGRNDIQLVLPKEVSVSGRVLEADSEKGVAGIQIVSAPENIRDCIHTYIPQTVVSDPNGRFRFAGLPPGKHGIKLVRSEGEIVERAIQPTGLDTTSGNPIDDVTLRELGKRGVLEFVVKDAQARQPITDMPLSIYGRGISMRCQRVPHGTGMLRLPEGQYTLSIGGRNTLYQEWRDTVQVNEGETVEREILLDRSPLVTGVVQDERGNPAAGVWVNLQPFDHETETYSDSEGRFKIVQDNDRPKKYCVMAHDVGRNLAGVTEYKLDSGEVTVVLKPGLTVTGEIVDSENRPIPAARVTFHIHIANYLSDIGAEVIADSHGRYEVNALRPQTKLFSYRISVHAAGFGRRKYDRITVQGDADEPVRLDPIPLKPANQSVTGIVVDSEGKPAGGVPIFTQGDGQPDRTSATDVEGRFTATQVCEGPLRLQAGFDSDPEGAGFLEAAGGDQDVKIILGQELVHSREESLCGKSLGDLKAFQLEISPEEIKDKLVLLCFFDMNQRPSRHTIKILKKKSQMLARKGVVVLVVQTAPIDKGRFEKWKQSNKIEFPVGWIRKQIDEVRVRWGVQSLPWLILTDREHTVQAEGFRVAELGEKLRMVQK